MSAVETNLSVRWWPLAVGAVVYVVAFLTPLTVIVDVVLLVAAVTGLTRRPSTMERRILIGAIVVLTLTIAAFIVLWLIAMALSSTHSGTSTPL